jgi:spore germination protein KC
MSVDKVDDDFVIGISVKKINPSSGGTGDDSGDNTTTIMQQSGKSISQAIQQLQSRSPKTIFFGDIEMILVSTIVLQHNFGHFVDFFVRSGDFSEYTNVYAVDKSALSMLNDMHKSGVDTVDIAIKARAIESSTWTKPINFLQMIHILQDYDSGVVPTIQRVYNGNELEFEVSGFGVMRDSQLRGILNKSSTRGFNVICNNIKTSKMTLDVALDEDIVIVGLDNVKTKSNIKYNSSTSRFDISVDIAADITELSHSDLMAQDTLVALVQTNLSKTIHDDVQECINQVVALSTDFVGLYDVFEWHNKSIARQQRSNWHDNIQRAQFSIDVNSTIRRTHLANVGN